MKCSECGNEITGDLRLRCPACLPTPDIALAGTKKYKKHKKRKKYKKHILQEYEISDKKE